MDKIEVSVIVPVYNAGEHLKRCLDSLVLQTMERMEIILVLDCPTDGSDIVAEHYAKKYKNIKILKNTKNLHIGESRNRGIKVAQGKYIGFCDHDDYMAPNMYEILYKRMEEEQSDIAVSPYISIDILANGSQQVGRHIVYPSLDVSMARDILWPIIVGTKKGDYISKDLVINIWNKLYRKEIIDKYQILFLDTKEATAEDVDFMCKYLYFCHRVSIVNTDLYYHVWGIGNTSVSNAYNTPANTVNFLYSMRNFINSNNAFNSEIQDRFQNTIISSVLRTARFSKSGCFLKRIIYIMDTFTKCDFVVHAFLNTSLQKILYGKTFKEKLFIVFIREYMKFHRPVRC